MKCRICKAYNGHHHPECGNITKKEAKKQLIQYYRLWLASQEKPKVEDEWGFLYWLARKNARRFQYNTWDKHCFQILEQLYAKYKGWV